MKNQFCPSIYRTWRPPMKVDPEIQALAETLPLELRVEATKHNPYLKDGSGHQINWSYTLRNNRTRAVTTTQYISVIDHDQEPELAEVLFVLANEARLVAKYPDAGDYARAVGVPIVPGSLGSRSARYILRAAQAHTKTLLKILGRETFDRCVGENTAMRIFGKPGETVPEFLELEEPWIFEEVGSEPTPASNEAIGAVDPTPEEATAEPDLEPDPSPAAEEPYDGAPAAETEAYPEGVPPGLDDEDPALEATPVAEEPKPEPEPVEEPKSYWFCPIGGETPELQTLEEIQTLLDNHEWGMIADPDDNVWMRPQKLCLPAWALEGEVYYVNPHNPVKITAEEWNDQTPGLICMVGDTEWRTPNIYGLHLG
jgi:hypothetical protein